MEGRSQATAATRTRVLDAAVEVLAEVGTQLLTMQAVAARADVALRTVYNHWPSKESLIVDAYSRLANNSRDSVIDLPVTDSARDDLMTFVDVWYDSLEREAPGAAAVMSVTGIPEYDAKVQEIRAWRRRALTAILKRAEVQGILRVPIKQATAIAFLWTAYVTWWSLVLESKLGPAGAKETALSSLDGALFTPHGR